MKEETGNSLFGTDRFVDPLLKLVTDTSAARTSLCDAMEGLVVRGERLSVLTEKSEELAEFGTVLHKRSRSLRPRYLSRFKIAALFFLLAVSLVSFALLACSPSDDAVQ